MSRPRTARAADRQFDSVDQAWRCESCQFLLGYIDSSGQQSRFKLRDFYLWVWEPLAMRTVCRKCGCSNEITDHALIAQRELAAARAAAPASEASPGNGLDLPDATGVLPKVVQ